MPAVAVRVALPGILLIARSARPAMVVHNADIAPVFEQIAEVISHGGTRSTVVLACGLQVDLRVVRHASDGHASRPAAAF
jgi:DNA polymerase (family 10)